MYEKAAERVVGPMATRTISMETGGMVYQEHTMNQGVKRIDQEEANATFPPAEREARDQMPTETIECERSAQR